jgi:rod shape-determining protein MreB
VLGVGEAARLAAATQSADLVNPFKHPRSLLSDFTVAEVILRAFLKKLFDGRLFAGAPIVVLHPRVNPEGGFTQIEIRALRELAMGAGASKAVVWHGRDLTNDELQNLRFGSGGEVLN